MLVATPVFPKPVIAPFNGFNNNGATACPIEPKAKSVPLCAAHSLLVLKISAPYNCPTLSNNSAPAAIPTPDPTTAPAVVPTTGTTLPVTAPFEAPIIEPTNSEASLPKSIASAKFVLFLLSN